MNLKGRTRKNLGVLRRELVKEVMIMAGVRFLRRTLKRSIRVVTGLLRRAGSITKSVRGVDLSQGLLRRMSFRSEEDIATLVGSIVMTELTQGGARDVGDMKDMTGNILEKTWKEKEVRRGIWTGKEAFEIGIQKEVNGERGILIGGGKENEKKGGR